MDGEISVWVIKCQKTKLTKILVQQEIMQEDSFMMQKYGKLQLDLLWSQRQ